MPRPSYAFKPRSIEEATASLRRDLAREIRCEPRAPRARPLKSIAGPIRLSVEEMIADMTIALYPKHGRALVGRVVAVRRCVVVVAVWGIGPLQTLEIADIAFFRLVGAHSWDERRRVTEIQREGGCAIK